MVGRTKYADVSLKQVMALAKEGRTERQIALEIGVHQGTISAWKMRYPEFRDLLETWKYDADRLVEQSLFERATGYDHWEEKIFCSKDGHVTRVETMKHYPPDVKAIMFWLNNRQPQLWSIKQEVAHTGSVGLAEKIAKARARSSEKQEEISDEADFLG